MFKSNANEANVLSEFTIYVNTYVDVLFQIPCLCYSESGNLGMHGSASQSICPSILVHSSIIIDGQMDFLHIYGTMI